MSEADEQAGHEAASAQDNAVGFGPDVFDEVMTREELDEAVFDLEQGRKMLLIETERLGKQIVNANNRIDELMAVLIRLLEGPEYPVVLDKWTCKDLREILCHTHRIDNENPEDFQKL